MNCRITQAQCDFQEVNLAAMCGEIGIQEKIGLWRELLRLNKQIK